MLIENLKSAVEDLGVSNDLVSIKSALHAICSEFGHVSKLDVLLARLGDQRQALCFLRMKNAEHEQQIMQYLELAQLPCDLVVIVNLPTNLLARRVGVAMPVVDLAMA